jgi:hypothetical protein
MTDKRDAFEYDIALSFAKADEAIAGELADRLIAREIKVFLDEYSTPGQWGKDMVDHLVNLFARKARYCILLISSHYPLHSWTTEERTFTGELALRDAEEYILPIQLDDRDVPGIREAKGYRDLRQGSLESIINVLAQKLNEQKSRSGPPSQSHDLRSGNVPHEKS